MRSKCSSVAWGGPMTPLHPTTFLLRNQRMLAKLLASSSCMVHSFFIPFSRAPVDFGAPISTESNEFVLIQFAHNRVSSNLSPSGECSGLTWEVNPSEFSAVAPVLVLSVRGWLLPFPVGANFLFFFASIFRGMTSKKKFPPFHTAADTLKHSKKIWRWYDLNIGTVRAIVNTVKIACNTTYMSTRLLSPKRPHKRHHILLAREAFRDSSLLVTQCQLNISHRLKTFLEALHISWESFTPIHFCKCPLAYWWTVDRKNKMDTSRRARPVNKTCRRS